MYGRPSPRVFTYKGFECGAISDFIGTRRMSETVRAPLGGNCGLDQKEDKLKTSAWTKEYFSNPNGVAGAGCSGAAAMSKVDGFE
jgi:hypothetical protein